MLYRGAKVIILDEPTAVLVPQEVDALFANLRELKRPGAHPDLHLPQARRGARGRRRHHRRPARHHRGRGPPDRGHRPQARRADGRLRAALAEHRGVHGHRRGDARARPTSPSPTPPAAGCSRTSRCGSTAARCSASPASRATARPSSPRSSWACGTRPAVGSSCRRRHHRLVHPPAPRVRDRLHPRGPAAPRAAARLAAVGEPHPRPPDPPALGQGGLARPRRRPQGQRSASSTGTTSAPRRSTPPRGRCPAATSRSSSSAAR